MSSPARRLLPAVLTAVLTGGLAAAPLLPASPAAAVPSAIPADCGALDVTDTDAVVTAAEGTDDVFLGRVVRAVTRGAGTGPAAGGPRNLRYEVVVDQAVVGDLAADQRRELVLVGVEGRQDPLRRSRRYLFFTTGENSELRADGCEGWASGSMVDAATLGEIRAALTAPPEPPEVALSRPDGAGDPPDLGRVVAPGAAISLVGILGLVLLSRVGRRRS
ncbi:hypothetical protein L615_001300000120 [Nocardioides sp. J9]|uniref:hypothetical protein n=1 Tax=Nocardioides sp. J9 TaxID=935844 RepID=UPI0011A7DB86|nr:hypothetical protein [Nocardioides sp. J9]TWH02648.1 hypothetical protein L615_001300000120 [Nocardioides sp. J9]